MFLKNAFKFIIEQQGRVVTISRKGTTASVKMAASNYFRNFSAPEEMAIEGKEFVVYYDDLVAESFPLPLRRGDIIKDPGVWGNNTISEVREMIILGKLIGYRLRTE